MIGALEIQVRDFGPIRGGTVALRPLTVLIGPNNAGKSYFAALTYSLVGIFTRSAGTAITTPVVGTRIFKVPHTLEELPDEIQTALKDAVRSFVEDTASILKRELERCFGSELATLARAGCGGFGFSLHQSEHRFRVGFESVNGGLRVAQQTWDISGTTAVSDLSHPVCAATLCKNIITKFFCSFLTPSHYLPAARSGTLQGHKALAAFLVARLPLLGIEPLNVPRLSGIVADFISSLLTLERRRQPTEATVVAAFLESEVCHGKIDLQPGDARLEYPEIYYQENGQKLPLHRTSSMVSEIAPVVLFLKYLVNRGDLLIIEEPEAHLHPDSQRTLARAIVKLIRCGVQVLVTTHSDYFLQQISNFVQLAQMPDERLRLGYDEGDYLSADDVGVYLFRLDQPDPGTVIQELQVTAEDGVPEDEFVRIAEEIYSETTALDRARLR